MAWMSKPRLEIWSCFLVGCFTIMASSSIASFNSYADDLKGTFNLSQLEVEILASFGNLGQCAALPTGILLEKFGSRLAFLTAIIFVVPAYFLLWQARELTSSLAQHWIVLAVLMLFIGIGSTIMYLTTLTVNLNNFPRRHRGKVVGFLSMLFWVGPALFSSVFAIQYSMTKFVLDYFFTLAILTLIVNVLAAVFIHRVQSDNQLPKEQNDVFHVNQSTEHIYAEAVIAHHTEVNITGRALFTSPTYHLLGWVFILSSAVDSVYLNNQGIILDSCQNLELTFWSNLMGPLMAMFANVASGILSDRLAKKVPREAFIIGSGVMQATIMLLSVFLPCNRVVFLTSLLVGYFSYGVNFTILPTLVCAYFGLAHFSRNWGAVMLVYGIMSGVLLLSFGFFYDNEISELYTHYCYGPSCFMVIFIIGSSISTLAFFLSLILLIQAMMSRKIQPEIAPMKPEARVSSYSSIMSEPIIPREREALSRRFSLVYGSQLIQRSFSLEMSEKTSSCSLGDWLHTSQ